MASSADLDDVDWISEPALRVLETLRDALAVHASSLTSADADSAYVAIQGALDACHRSMAWDDAEQAQVDIETHLREIGNIWWNSFALLSLPVPSGIRSRLRLECGLSTARAAVRALALAMARGDHMVSVMSGYANDRLWIPVIGLLQVFDAFLEVDYDGSNPGVSCPLDMFDEWLSRGPGLLSAIRAWICWLHGQSPDMAEVPHSVDEGYVQSPLWMICVPAYALKQESMYGRAAEIFEAWMRRPASHGVWCTDAIDDVLSPSRFPDASPGNASVPPSARAHGVVLPKYWAADMVCEGDGTTCARDWLCRVVGSSLFGGIRAWGRGVLVRPSLIAQASFPLSEAVYVVVSDRGVAVHGDAIALALTHHGVLPPVWLEYRMSPRHMLIQDLLAYGWASGLRRCFPEIYIGPEWNWSSWPWIVLHGLPVPEWLAAQCAAQTVELTPCSWDDMLHQINPRTAVFGFERPFPSPWRSAPWSGGNDD